MKLTIRKDQFLLTEASCPDFIDPVMFKRVTEKYDQLSAEGTPVVEAIFDYVVRQMEVDVLKDVCRKILKENPSVSEREAKIIAQKASSEAIDMLMESLEDEVMMILKHQKLCYLTYSLRMEGDGDSMINSPQTDPLWCMEEVDYQ